jgi:Domain of unknown function (DUF4105)
MIDGSVPHLAADLLATLAIALSAVWGVCALWYRACGKPALKMLSAALWAAFGAGVLAALWQGRAILGLTAYTIGFLGLLVWWYRLRPSNDRVWADDVARMTTGTVSGSVVTLHNVRNFAWRTNSDYTQRWETRSYELDRLESVDMIMSHWTGRMIAHMLISFGFEGGEYVAFSVEIRREKHQSFSEIGGFFKEFELSVIAADERDVVRVRTNVRGEDDFLYRLIMPTATMRSLFLGYVDEANRLAQAPRFYNTITVNCTTLVYQMMKRIAGGLPWSYRVLLSGYMPEYVYSIGRLDSRYSLAQLREGGRISERAKRADLSATFSEDIRSGVPGIEREPAANAEGTVADP